ncbi:MFS transporter [Patescibacteria group bacterium]|nr:MFS transporter [Patescibacteria group bacterium]
MTTEITLAKRRRIFKAIYMIGFFFGLANAVPAYISSEFLAQYAGTKTVGLVFIASAIVTLAIFSVIGRLLKKYGDFAVATFLAALAILALLGLVLLNNPWLIFLLYIIYSVSGSILYFSLDIFLVTNLTENITGTVRGSFMSIYNSAWIMAPIIAGLIMATGNYRYVFLASLIVFVPILSLIRESFGHFKDSPYRNVSIVKIVRTLPRHQSTYKILASNFLLQFFYSWMIIYTPIYLHTYLGFSWVAVGIMFTVMLLPFALLEAPLGRLADTRFGEKEMLSIGFVIAALTTAALSFITMPIFLLWTAGLLATRIGASTIEIMNETYFFKKNQESHPEIIGLFRMTGPLAYIVAAFVATILLQFIDYRYLFLVLGFIMLWGLRYSLTLKDTL